VVPRCPSLALSHDFSLVSRGYLSLSVPLGLPLLPVPLSDDVRRRVATSDRFFSDERTPWFLNSPQFGLSRSFCLFAETFLNIASRSPSQSVADRWPPGRATKSFPPGNHACMMCRPSARFWNCPSFYSKLSPLSRRFRTT